MIRTLRSLCDDVPPLLPTCVTRARALAASAHAGQMYGRQPYLQHLDDVATLVAPYGCLAQVLAFLHDALEDTALDREVVRDEFGGLVVDGLDLLSDPPGSSRGERKAAANARLLSIDAHGRLAVVLVVKVADRLANVRASLGPGGERKLAMYQREHATFRAAAHRPGLAMEIWAELDSALIGASRRL